MSRTAGAFTETQLQNVRAMADKLMLDDRIKQQYNAHVEVVEAAKKAQTANLNVIMDKQTKDYTVEVEWINTCGLETQAQSDCTFDGTKSSTNTQTYDFNIEREVEFVVDEADLTDNDTERDEHIAKLFLRADVLLSEWFAQQVVAYINTFLGVNQLGTSGKGVVLGNLTYIAPEYWDATLLPYLLRVGIVNRFTSPVMLSGQNLFEQYYTAKYNSGNANGKGAANMFDDMNINFDLFNIDAVNTPNLLTYMISMGAIAMVNKTYYTTTPFVGHDETRYAIPSKFLQGMSYDVHYRNQCSSEDSNRMQHSFKVRLKGGVYQNPEGCTANNTGFLAFICGTL